MAKQSENLVHEPALSAPLTVERSELELDFTMPGVELPQEADLSALSVMRLGRMLSRGRLAFRIGSHDFAAGAGELCLLSFALDLRALLTGLRPEDHERLHFGESPRGLHLIRIGETVRIAGGGDEGSEMVLYTEAVSAARAFVGRIARELLGRHPSLLHHKELARLTVA